MPIFTTVLSGSGLGNEDGFVSGVGGVITGSLHIYSGSTLVSEGPPHPGQGQPTLNITGSVLASSDVIIGGDIKTFVKAGPSGGESIHTLMSFEKDLATPKLTIAGDLQIGGNDINDSGGAWAIKFDGSQNARMRGNVQVDGNIAGDADESKTIFAESTSAASTITIGGGGDLVIGGTGDLQLSSTGYINDAGGHARFTATDAGETILSDADGTTVVTVHASDLSTTLAGDISVAGNISGDADESKTIFAESTSAGSTITLGGGGLFIAGGDVQVNGNDIKDSGGNNQITFSAGSQASFAYDIDVTGTGSAAAFQIGTDTDGNRAPDPGYPLRVSNEDGDVGINIDSKNNKVGSLLFSEDGDASGMGWFVDYGADNGNRASFRASGDPQGEGAIVIHSTMKAVRVGGGDLSGDGYDDDASLLITSSEYNRPSMLRLRTLHGSRSTQAYPVISWMHETAASNNTGHWAMGIDPTSVGDGDTAGEYLRITATGPGSSAMTAGTVSMTFRAGGSDARVGIGGVTGGRMLIPTGTLHVENGKTEGYSLTQDLEKAQLLLGNSGNSTGEITAGMWMDVSNDPDIEKHTAHIVAVNTDVRAGHKGYLSVALYDGSGNINSTRSRLRIDEGGGALFISGTRPAAGGGYPRNADNYYNISELDVPSGSITAISLMDGAYGKDPATINLVSWKGSTGNKGTVSAGDNLGRIAWVSNDSDFSTAAERTKTVAAYIESIATEAHSDANNAPGNMDFYVRGSGQATPQKILTLQTGSVELTGSLWIEHDIIVPQGGAIRDKNKNIFMSFGPGAAFPNGEVRFDQDVRISGTTPKLTIGDGGAEDTTLVFDGSSKDWYAAVDETSKNFVIGQGSAIGDDNRAIEILESGGQTLTVISGTLKLGSIIQDNAGTNSLLLNAGNTTVYGELLAVGGVLKVTGTTPTLTIGDGGTEDCKLLYNGSAADFYVGVDDTDDKLHIGLGSAVGTTPNMTLESASRDVLFNGDISVGGNGIKDSGGVAAITFDGSQNTTLAGNLAIPGSIIHVGDIDTKMEFGTNTQTYTCGNSERLKMNSTGVGIGGATPIAGLAVTGDIETSTNITVGDGNFYAAAGQTLALNSPHHIIMKLDTDNNGTASFQIDNGAGTEVLNVDESGNLQIDGNITVGGNIIKASDGGSAITLDTSDNVTIGGNLQTTTVAYTDGDSAITIADGGYTKHTVGVQNAGGILVSDDANAADNEWCKFAMATPTSKCAEGTFIVNLGGAMAGTYVKSSTYIIFAKAADNSATNMILTAEPLSRGLDGPNSDDDGWDPATDLACTWANNVAELWIKTTTTNCGCWVTALSGPSVTEARITPWTIPIGADQEGWLASIDDLGTITYGTWAEKIFSKITLTDQGGLILGYSAYDPGSQEDWTTSGTTFAFIVDGSANKKSITFTAPTSGQVEVTAKVWVNQDTTINAAYFLKMALSTNAGTMTPIAGTEKFVFLTSEHASVGSQGLANISWAITGLTPGTSYTYYLGAAETNALQEHVLSWGEKYPALIIQAVSLPESIVS